MTEDHLRDEELRRLAGRLGSKAADRLNLDRLGSAVVARLQSDRRPGHPAPRWWSQPGWLRAAAAILLMAGGGLLLRQVTRVTHQAHFVADDLQDLSADQLREVLGALDPTLAEPAAVEPTENDLDGLTTEQLERLLQSLEG
jgi:hypothetical protein